LTETDLSAIIVYESEAGMGVRAMRAFLFKMENENIKVENDNGKSIMCKCQNYFGFHKFFTFCAVILIFDF
jgi:hypothetical protein